MSEVIEAFIRKHPGLPESESFEAFLREPRIRAWVGDDLARRDRLQREFTRVWATLGAASAPASGGPAATLLPTRPAPPAPPEPEPVAPIVPAPARTPPQPVRIETHAPAPERHEPTHPHGAARRLHLLCPSCARTDVWLQGGHISCHHCGARYDDMLALVPVKPVGPFEYVFGEGARGILTAAGVALLFLAVYGVLKWL